MSKELTRRSFIRHTVGAGATLALSSKTVFAQSSGIPLKTLGKTGEMVPRIALGLGSRWCSVQDEDKALAILDYAYKNGMFHWDTAHSYQRGDVISEERVGKILPPIRDKIFLSSKTHQRDADDAMREIETSLKRLDTDHFDILQVHLIRSLEDAKELGKKGGIVDLLEKLKQEKVTRFIGFTGHLTAQGMKYAAENYNFDTMLIALNHYGKGEQKFEEQAVPAASQEKMGVMVMKVVRPRETVENLPVPDLIRYALSLNHVDSAVIGIDSIEVLKENIGILKGFKRLPKERMLELKTALQPFYRSKKLPWMSPSYRDGQWV